MSESNTRVSNVTKDIRDSFRNIISTVYQGPTQRTMAHSNSVRVSHERTQSGESDTPSNTDIRKHNSKERKMTDTFQGRIVVYSTLGCPHSKKAKKTLTDLNLPFTDVGLDRFCHIRDDVIKHSDGKVTLPQIFFNDTWIGGDAELTKLVQADKETLIGYIDDVKMNPLPPDEWPVVPDAQTAGASVDPHGIPCKNYYDLIEDLKVAGVVKSKGLFSKKYVLHATDFMKWAMESNAIKDDEMVAGIGQALIDRHFIFDEADDGRPFSAKPGKKYTVNDFGNVKALNGGDASRWVCGSQDVDDIGERLRQMTLELYDKYLSEDAMSVDYKGMKDSDEFVKYKTLTTELTRLNIKEATRQQKLAFFINVYNALVIHANIEKGPPRNFWARYRLFYKNKYIIGSLVYSLQDIENGVLRSNRKGIGQCSPPFPRGDRRLKVALDRHEPLVHFALVCGAKSCPPIKTYSAKNIYKELKLAAMSFLGEDEQCVVDVNKRTVGLSSIFKWYRVDFGKDDKELLEFVAAHMAEGEKQQQLQTLISGGNFKVHFLKYDWSVNEMNIITMMKH